jgi:hypothetical protein
MPLRAARSPYRCLPQVIDGFLILPLKPFGCAHWRSSVPGARELPSPLLDLSGYPAVPTAALRRAPPPPPDVRKTHRNRTRRSG